ncbi:putative nuclease HARBI1 [Epinephelus fuscoguttatus]|uniref:putative nuclease HARBI1 n=1 Tax=Epinephelus fuscoguttatus TaxID=293821 RepID=UPI0020D02875|nr:putative nuclease HARBI1 [Epinephelus fuscoguttatus]
MGTMMEVLRFLLSKRCVVQVLRTFCTMVPTFISWFTECEKLATSAALRAMCGIDGIIGAIDGCHIKLQRPPIRGGDYLNRKRYYSVVLQGMVDGRGTFRDIFVGAPGRVHDSRILRKSAFIVRWGEKMGRYMLLGNSTYISRKYPFIVTPKRGDGALTIQDQQRNTQICKGRVVVEQAFGRWNRRTLPDPNQLHSTCLELRASSSKVHSSSHPDPQLPLHLITTTSTTSTRLHRGFSPIYCDFTTSLEIEG